jgi:hypothetical protein
MPHPRRGNGLIGTFSARKHLYARAGNRFSGAREAPDPEDEVENAAPDDDYHED